MYTCSILRGERRSENNNFQASSSSLSSHKEGPRDETDEGPGIVDTNKLPVCNYELSEITIKAAIYNIVMYVSVGSG